MNNQFWRPYNWFVGVNAGITQTALSNQFTPVISGASLTKKNSFSLSIETGYLFSKYFGLSAGFGISPYFSQLSLDNYSNSLEAIDSENEEYERLIEGNNIREKQRVFFLEVPVMLNFLLPTAKTNGFYVNSGVNIKVPIINTYSSSGIYSYSGYYPAYNVTLTDIPYEGFKSNSQNNVEGNLNLKTINPELIVIGGYYLYPVSRYKISLGIFYKRTLTDISKYSELSEFHLSTHENQVNSLIEGSERVTASSTGVIISARYFLK